MGKQLGRYRCHDSMGVGARRIADADPSLERHFDKGNAQYILSLSPGNYEAEDAGKMMNIFRIDDNGTGSERELVVSVPAGTYHIDSDQESGAHLYRTPDDEPERQPLSDTPLALFANRDHDGQALQRMNARQAAHYAKSATGDGGGLASQHVTHRDMTEHLDARSASAALAALNGTNHRFWGTK